MTPLALFTLFFETQSLNFFFHPEILNAFVTKHERDQTRNVTAPLSQQVTHKIPYM